MEAKDDHKAVKLLLTYDPRPEQRDEYFHFVLGEFVPALEQLGLTMCEVWHTAYGNYPLRLTGFLAEDMQAMQGVLASDAFQKLEGRLLTYVENYRRRVVGAGKRFQF
jgi:hypothetical protein